MTARRALGLTATVIALASSGCATAAAPVVPSAVAASHSAGGDDLVVDVSAPATPRCDDVAIPSTTVRPSTVLARAPRSNATVEVARAEHEAATLTTLAAAQAELEAFEGFSIAVPRGATLEQWVDDVLAALRDGAARAARVIDAFEGAVNRHVPEATIAGLVGQGRTLEVLASAILNISAPSGSGLPAAVGDRVLEALDPETRVLECRAIRHYALAARAARLISMDDASTRLATSRLAVFGGDLVGECLELMRNGDRERGIDPDPRLAPYCPGEFDRAPRGATLPLEPSLPLEPGRAAPPLAGE